MEKLIDNVRKAFEARIGKAEFNWLDQKSAEAAIDKLEALDILVGPPSEFRKKDGFLTKFYGFTQNNYGTSHFSNSLKSAIQLNRLQFENFAMNYGHLVLSFFTDWSEVNAFYTPTLNTYIMPYGFFQEPVYAPGLPMAFLYGAIGSIAGHEITHSFGISRHQNG